MNMRISERDFTIDKIDLAGLNPKTLGFDPIRFAVVEAEKAGFRCTAIAMEDGPPGDPFPLKPAPPVGPGDDFNVALVIPTGLGATVGGRAGDAGPVARLMASVCDTLVTHPNVVNASDINEMTDNTLYVEGHMLTEYLLGRVGLGRTRQNRVLVVVDGSADPRYIDAAVNAVNAARATYGLDCPEILVLDPPFVMETGWSDVGRASGSVTDIDRLFKALYDRAGRYDAVALTSLIRIPAEVRDSYYTEGGVNPWGGVEAMLTHAISRCLRVPCAHSPMMESVEVEGIDYGVIDPRDAAEIISLTYLQCVLKGLHRAPRFAAPGPDPSCIVTPRMCLGLPALAARARGIPIIAVNDRLEVGCIDCTNHVNAVVVDNYVEAAGAVAALRAGVSLESLRRPLGKVKVTRG